MREDVAEMREQKVKERTIRRYVWWQFFLAIRPMLGAWIGKAVKWGLVAAVVDGVKRMFLH